MPLRMVDEIVGDRKRGQDIIPIEFLPFTGVTAQIALSPLFQCQWRWKGADELFRKRVDQQHSSDASSFPSGRVTSYFEGRLAATPRDCTSLVFVV